MNITVNVVGINLKNEQLENNICKTNYGFNTS